MRKKNHKYIFVIGGVMSGVGKGIAVASIGQILQSKGFKVNPIKIDPYLNVDAGTMNPTEHGEVFVLDSGLECDQDMGNYERFMDLSLRNEDYVTSGMVYKYVIEKERNFGYRGRCVEAIPHIRDEILRRIRRAAELNGSNISLVEIGGTVGDYQNAMFIEAARVLKLRNPDDVIFIMISYVPIPKKLGEMKTRPTQNAVRSLNSYGVQPDIIIARSEKPLDKKRKDKIAMACSIPADNVISAPDISSIYDVPINFEKDKLGEIILNELKTKAPKKTSNLSKWKNMVGKMRRAKKEVSIAIVGKYFDTGDFTLSDSYLSIIEAIKFSAGKLGIKPEISWINSKDFSAQGGSASGRENIRRKIKGLNKFDGIIIPGGFGESGIDGKLAVIKYARENKIPFLGLCYGMQLAVIEYARNVAGLKRAQTTEIDENTPEPVIDIMPDQKKKLAQNDYGGSMRLGSYLAVLKRGTLARKIYGKDLIEERHRHRYEINPEYVDKLSESGIIFSGISPDKKLMEMMELPQKKHPFFVASQFHPEFKARPLSPHPLFTAFIKASSNKKK